VKNRMREICTSGTVGGEGGNILAYPATTKIARHLVLDHSTDTNAPQSVASILEGPASAGALASRG
jgi:hypothetical protein